MAHFYAGVSGKARTEATRLGSENRPTSTFNNGWNLGVEVNAFVDDEGRDCFRVYATHGSNGYGGSKEIAVVKEGPDREIVIHYPKEEGK